MSIQNTLWVERHRPQKLDECVLTEDIRSVAEGIVQKGELPNLLLCGSAGTGKTTLAKALCNEFGYDSIIINGSNDRNIDVLRTTITQFASSMSINSHMKVVILDEADYLNPTSTQPALRNFIEEFSKTTRFIFTCNYPQKIIQPLHSRCSVLDFTIKSKDKPTIASQIMKRVIHILETENIEYSKQAVAKLIAKYFPDFRRVINELQRYASINGKIDEGVIGATELLEIDDFVKSLKSRDFKSAKRWIVESLATVDQHVMYRKVYDSLYEYIEPESIPQAILLIANYQYRGMTAVDPEINCAAFAVEMMSDLKFK